MNTTFFRDADARSDLGGSGGGMSEIEKGNKLVAEFMGWQLVCLNADEKDPEDCYYEYHRKDAKGNVLETHSGGDCWCWSKNSIMEFHNDWSRLMPVVEQIESDGNYQVEIDLFSCYIMESKNLLDDSAFLVESHEDNKKEAVWQAVIQFLQWYNTSQHTK